MIYIFLFFSLYSFKREVAFNSAMVPKSSRCSLTSKEMLLVQAYGKFLYVVNNKSIKINVAIILI